MRYRGSMAWRKTTQRVLNRLRTVSQPILNRQQSTEHERACVNRVWAFVTVDIGERGEKKPVVKGPERQARVKEQLLKKFAEEAFSANAFEADEVLNDFLTRDVLAWGDQLLAEDAANAAMSVDAAFDEALRLLRLGEHEGDGLA